MKKQKIAVNFNERSSIVVVFEFLVHLGFNVNIVNNTLTAEKPIKESDNDVCCGNCLYIINDGDKYCRHCGEKMTGK